MTNILGSICIWKFEVGSSVQPFYRFHQFFLPLFFLFNQELRSWEEELTQAALQQKCQEEALRRREQELAEREIHILERELNIIIHQLYQEKPHVESRQGKFRRNRLKLKDGNRISLPSGSANKLWCCSKISSGALVIIIITFYF